MPGALLNRAHHFARYCRPKQVDQSSGRVSAVAFRLRPDETYLSGSCLELIAADHVVALVEVRRRARLTLSASGRYAVGQIDPMLGYVWTHTEDQRQLTASCEPLAAEPGPPPYPADSSHSGLWGYEEEEDEIAELLARFMNGQGAIHPGK